MPEYNAKMATEHTPIATNSSVTIFLYMPVFGSIIKLYGIVKGVGAVFSLMLPCLALQTQHAPTNTLKTDAFAICWPEIA